MQSYTFGTSTTRDTAYNDGIKDEDIEECDQSCIVSLPLLWRGREDVASRPCRWRTVHEFGRPLRAQCAEDTTSPPDTLGIGLQERLNSAQNLNLQVFERCMPTAVSRG